MVVAEGTFVSICRPSFCSSALPVDPVVMIRAVLKNHRWLATKAIMAGFMLLCATKLTSLSLGSKAGFSYLRSSPKHTRVPGSPGEFGRTAASAHSSYRCGCTRRASSQDCKLDVDGLSKGRGRFRFAGARQHAIRQHGGLTPCLWCLAARALLLRFCQRGIQMAGAGCSGTSLLLAWAACASGVGAVETAGRGCGGMWPCASDDGHWTAGRLAQALGRWAAVRVAAWASAGSRRVARVRSRCTHLSCTLSCKADSSSSRLTDPE